MYNCFIEYFDKACFMANSEHCKKVRNHINRLGGQLEALGRYVDEGAECSQIIHLFKSFSSSVDSLKAKIIEGYLEEAEMKTEKMSDILRLVKS